MLQRGIRRPRRRGSVPCEWPNPRRLHTRISQGTHPQCLVGIGRITGFVPMAILVVSLTRQPANCARFGLAAVLVASYASSPMRKLPACVEISFAANVPLMGVHAHSLMRLSRSCVMHGDSLANAIDLPVCSFMPGRKSCVSCGSRKGIVIAATAAGIVISSDLKTGYPPRSHQGRIDYFSLAYGG